MAISARLFIIFISTLLFTASQSDASRSGGRAAGKQPSNYRYETSKPVLKGRRNYEINAAFSNLSKSITSRSGFERVYQIYRELMSETTIAEVRASNLDLETKDGIVNFDRAVRRAIEISKDIILGSGRDISLIPVPKLVDAIFSQEKLSLPIEPLNLLPKTDKHFISTFGRPPNIDSKFSLDQLTKSFTPFDGQSSVAGLIGSSGARIYIIIAHNEGGFIRLANGNLESIGDISSACRASGSICVVLSCRACEFFDSHPNIFGANRDISLAEVESRAKTIYSFLGFAQRRLSRLKSGELSIAAVQHAWFLANPLPQPVSGFADRLPVVEVSGRKDMYLIESFFDRAPVKLSDLEYHIVCRDLHDSHDRENCPEPPPPPPPLRDYWIMQVLEESCNWKLRRYGCPTTVE